jgi:hypothetical protein
MKKHKFYFTDSSGAFNGYERQLVWIDATRQILHLGRSLAIPLCDVINAEVRPLPRFPEVPYLAVDVCGPTVENGSPTTLALIHKNFFAKTKRQPMQEFVDEIRPFIKDRTLPLREADSQLVSGNSQYQSVYALNISLVIGYYRKKWYSFDTPTQVFTKTLFLMLLGGVVNIIGVLLIVVPFDNYKMSQNLVRAGWRRPVALWWYVLLTYPAYAFWCVHIVRSLISKSD